MSTKTLARTTEMLPSLFDDFIRPWSSWMDTPSMIGRTQMVPAVNITETKDEYILSLAAPGMKKDDFNIDVTGNMITISSEKEQKSEVKDELYTRKEYNYTTFSRNFTLPDEVNRERIDARYEDGILKLSLPKKEEAKKMAANKHIVVK
jgi:HSP20 family protein